MFEDFTANRNQRKQNTCNELTAVLRSTLYNIIDGNMAIIIRRQTPHTLVKSCSQKRQVTLIMCSTALATPSQKSHDRSIQHSRFELRDLIFDIRN